MSGGDWPSKWLGKGSGNDCVDPQLQGELDAYDAAETCISFYKLRYNILTHMHIFTYILYG